MKKVSFLLIILLFVSALSYSQTETEAANLFFPRNVSNKFVNEAEANKTLSQIAAEFLKNVSSGKSIKINAYAADTPNDFDPWTLSEERAAFVQNALVELGIDKKYIEAIGKGATSVWGNNEYEEERQPNRRATIIVVDNAPIIVDPPRPPEPSKYKSGFDSKKILTILAVILALVLIALFVVFVLPHIGGPIIGSMATLVNAFVPPISMVISSIADSAKILIPNKVEKTFENVAKGTRLPREWKPSKFDNTKGLLTRHGPNGEHITYTMYISNKGEKVIIGSDGAKYYVKGDSIKPFDDVPEFISKSGKPVINKGYAGTDYPDGVIYREKIVYDANGNRVRWEGPVFDNVSKFDITLPKEYLKLTEQEQYVEAYRQLREWISNNPKEAIKRFGAENAEKIKNGDTIGNAGYYTFHHSEEVGKLQVVSRTLHQELHPEIDGKHAHTGGMEIWGAGRNR